MDTAVIEDSQARVRGFDTAGRNRTRSRKVLAKEAVIGDIVTLIHMRWLSDCIAIEESNGA